ncbi:MAG TPA: UDP-N-acetylglucosamine 2-epimerase (non-hydrolyzing) [Clostridia bacterium]|nr:UDP-N-acetylglucosamine 2-epimerase (non-hydrolyzing) [Clostridia bacterium]
MKIVTVVGARPQFIKAAPVSLKLRESGITEIFVHTGQHYNPRMSGNFFRELNLPPPNYNLGVGSATHGKQTGRMLEALEAIMLREEPDWVLVYGDTNSTLAGALAAAKLHIPIAHVEAGIRSYNPVMPEEINRRLTDHVSTALLCPTEQAVRNLEQEGFNNILNGGKLTDIAPPVRLKTGTTPLVVNVGDVMYDMVLKTGRRLESMSPQILKRYQVSKDKYVLATVHRSENTDHKARLEGVIEGLSRLGVTVILPLHPRTKKYLSDYALFPRINQAKNIVLTEPLGYVELLSLLKNARCVVTDSGGIQKEAYLLGVPCLTCRNETEWPETVDSGWNRLVGLGGAELLQSFPFRLLQDKRPQWFGDGSAAQRIVQLLRNY